MTWSLEGTEASKAQHSDDFNRQDFPRTVKVMRTRAWGLVVPLDNPILKTLIQNPPQLLLCNYSEFELGPGGGARGLFIRYLEPGGAGGRGSLYGVVRHGLSP